MDVTAESIERNDVFSFFANHTRLESVRLRGTLGLGSLQPCLDALCSHLLDSCPRLRHLRVESRALPINGTLFLKMVESRLTTLCVRTSQLVVDSSQFCRQLENQNRRNTRLRTLVLDGNMGETVQLAFIDAFRRLRCLELRAVTDRVLQAIWKHQVRMRIRTARGSSVVRAERVKTSAATATRFSSARAAYSREYTRTYRFCIYVPTTRSSVETRDELRAVF